MYTKNSRGPRTVPCGNPERTGDSVDSCPSSSTSQVRSLRKSVIQMSVQFLILQRFSLSSRQECDSLSNAFEKSSSIASTCLELSIFSARLLTVSIDWDSHELFLRNPYWQSERLLCCSRGFMMLLCSMLHHFATYRGDGDWPIAGRICSSSFLEGRDNVHFFQSVGMTPCCTEAWKMSRKASATSTDVSLRRWVLAWLSIWGEMQTCMWPSWCHCHCHSLSLAPVNPDWFWFSLSGTGSPG